MRFRHRSDGGAVIVVVALLIMALFLIVALVVDLGVTRSDRRNGQAAVDNAVASATQTLALDGNGKTACTQAYEYLALSLDVAAFTGDSCDPLEVCQVTDAPVVRTSGDFRAVVYHPVPSGPAADGVDLMDSTSTIGADGGRGYEGLPCDRFGVRLTTTGDAFFGGIAGSTDRVSSVHAVGLITDGTDEFRPVNLLVLNRTECQVLTMSGNAEVIVASPTDAPTFPGVVASDSDASDGDCDPDSTVQNNGTNATLLAQGPCGTTPETNDCGRIELFAPPPGSGTCVPGDDVPSCDEGTGSITPNAVRLESRYTRARVDYRYDCRPTDEYDDEDWWSVQDIPGCPDESDDTDYIQEVLALGESLSPPSATWTLIEGGDCTPSAGPVKDIAFPPGNYFVNCDKFQVNGSRNIVFQGGNIIFKGDVLVDSGSLTLNRCAAADGCTNSISWSSGDNFVEDQYGPQAAWAYVAGSVTNKSTMTLNKTALILGTSASFFDQQGSGVVTWTAPDEGAIKDSAGPFDDLALWSEGATVHTFRGGGSSYFEGLFFGGLATFDLAGSGPVDLRIAQFVSDKLNLSGDATFTLSPVADRSVEFPIAPTFNLVR